MKLSFVIPAYNEEAYIDKCLASILAQIKTVDHDSEVIVVNNNSTDGTVEVVRKFPGVRLVDESRKGIVFARSAGFKQATGELIANVDADTILTPDWLAFVLKKFADDPTLVALSGPHIFYDASPNAKFFSQIYYRIGYIFYLFNRFFFGIGMLQGGNFIIKKSAFEQVGGYDTDHFIFYGEDTDVARRISKAGKVVFTFKLPILASGRRLNKEGYVVTGFKYVINYLAALFFKKPLTKKYTDVRPGR